MEKEGEIEKGKREEFLDYPKAENLETPELLKQNLYYTGGKLISPETLKFFGIELDRDNMRITENSATELRRAFSQYYYNECVTRFGFEITRKLLNSEVGAHNNFVNNILRYIEFDEEDRKMFQVPPMYLEKIYKKLEKEINDYKQIPWTEDTEKKKFQAKKEIAEKYIELVKENNPMALKIYSKQVNDRKLNPHPGLVNLLERVSKNLETIKPDLEKKEK